jgi:hypothetical protein
MLQGESCKPSLQIGEMFFSKFNINKNLNILGHIVAKKADSRAICNLGHYIIY